jgi:hypothetical protein
MPISNGPRRVALALFAVGCALVFYYLAQHEPLLALALLAQLPPLWLAARGRIAGLYLQLVTAGPIALLALRSGAPELAAPALAPVAGGLLLLALHARRLWRFDRAAAALALLPALALGAAASWGAGSRPASELEEGYWRWIGALDARSDAARGKQKLLSFGCAGGPCACGLPAPERELRRHGIAVECVTTSCLIRSSRSAVCGARTRIPRKQGDIWHGYHEEMKRLIELRFGAGFFERLRAVSAERRAAL